MPHATSTSTSAAAPRATSLNRSSMPKAPPGDTSADPGSGTEKFPDFDAGSNSNGFSGLNGSLGGGRADSPARRPNGVAIGFQQHQANGDKWTPRRDSRVRWAVPTSSPAPALGAQLGPQTTASSVLGHSRQRSISNAIRHMRSGSVSQNAHEIADALRAPVSYKLIMLCVMWYWSSALTNTSSKSILTAFDKPATLTLVQFALVAFYCILCSWLATVFPRLRTSVPALKYPIRTPSRDVIVTTLPLAAFQIVGHLLSSNATSKMPVSLVHTIKGLSPLFTVLAYRLIYDIRYPKATYYSLVPLTLGVMLACSGKHGMQQGEFVGIVYSLLATIIFVTQNIFSKKLFNEAARAEEQGLGAKSRKLDKLNLLCYSSGMAFILTLPIWFWGEGIGILGDFLWDGSVDLTETPNSFDHGRLTLEFLFNGTFHFGQNILAFVLLSMVSPVTYSVASLIKRVFVIIIAIIWFQSPTTRIQAVGIALTFLGLYLYDRSSEKNRADQKANTMTQIKGGDLPLLPLNTKQALAVSQTAPVFESPVNTAVPGQAAYPYTNGNSYSSSDDNKKSDDAGRGRARGTSNATWLPPGTKQEETWRLGDGKSAAP